jgi:hypothetical protein
MSADASVSLRGTYDGVSAAIAAAVDPRVSYVSPDIDRKTFVDALRENKLSQEYLKATTYDTHGSIADKEHRESRNRRLKRVTDRFDSAGIEYAPMKNLRTPKAMMSDIDVLVPDPSEEAQAVRLLVEEGYELYRFRLLAHPLKTMAVAPDDSGESTTGGARDWPVDFYPDAIWIRKRVCDPHRVVERTTGSESTEITGEDDLYLVATHAFSHLSVTFGELYHGVLVLNETDAFDWDYLLDVADEYGCADALYFYLRVLDDYLDTTGRKRVPTEVFDALEQYWVCRVIRRWYENADANQFPVQIPIRLACGVSLLHHIPRVSRHSTVRETWKDFQSHLLTAVSKLLLGET